MTIDRRSLIVGASALAMAPRVHAASEAREWALWPGSAPGGEGLTVRDEFVFRKTKDQPNDIAWTHVARPTLIVTRPAKPNGAAVLVIPGGGYARVALERAGSGIAANLAKRGFTAFDLKYRLPHDRWAAGPDTPLQDAQRAMRLIRSRAAGLGFDPTRVAALGFSAGGHLAARLGSRHGLTTYRPVDAVDRLSARPTALGLFFPVIKMDGPATHGQSRRELLGEGADPVGARTYSADADLPRDMPPTFIGHPADDPSVPVANSLAMFDALQKAKVPSELMIFERGGHGFPPPGADGKPYPWLDLVLAFTSLHGV
ncbi:MAG: alpha/beta hydrolase [Sphingomicrobium sp.]